MSVKLLNNLKGYLSDRVPGAQVRELQFLGSGVESDLYTFTLQPASGEAQALVLRVYPGDDVAEKLAREANGVRQLQQAEFPVAAILFYETDPAFLGKPFCVMERLIGQPLWPMLYQVPALQAEQLLECVGGLAARLHNLDWRPFTDQAERYQADPTAVIDDLLTPARQLHARFGVEGFTLVVDWLDAHKCDLAIRPAVAHLDFHANNVFACDDGRLVVIDWTQIGVADYRTDLSWTLMIMGDFGRPEWRERILAAYEKESGRLVENLDYFAVYTDLKLLASTVISRRAGPEALGMRPGSGDTREQQKQNIARLAGRIKARTGVAIPEVEETLHLP